MLLLLKKRCTGYHHIVAFRACAGKSKPKPRPKHVQMIELICLRYSIDKDCLVVHACQITKVLSTDAEKLNSSNFRQEMNSPKRLAISLFHSHFFTLRFLFKYIKKKTQLFK